MTSSQLDPNQLIEGQVLAAFGLVMVVVCYILRVRYHKNRKPHVSWAGMAFLAGCSVPIGIAFVLQPFLDKQLDYEEFKAFLPLAGISILWIVGMTVKQAVDLDNDRKE